MRVLIKGQAKHTFKDSFLKLSIGDFEITVPLSQNKKFYEIVQIPRINKKKLDPFLFEGQYEYLNSI